jgi:hypothetical protein
LIRKRAQDLKLQVTNLVEEIDVWEPFLASLDIEVDIFGHGKDEFSSICRRNLAKLCRRVIARPSSLCFGQPLDKA